jgi:uncharacterized protein (TIGR03067 family)
MKTLIGLWFVVQAHMGGNDITPAFANEKMEITDTGYKIWSGDTVSDSGSLTFFDGTNELDILGTNGPNQGKLFKCIYKMDGDNIVICYSLSGRPTDFESTKENKFVLITWTRK